MSSILEERNGEGGASWINFLDIGLATAHAYQKERSIKESRGYLAQKRGGHSRNVEKGPYARRKEKYWAESRPLTPSWEGHPRGSQEGENTQSEKGLPPVTEDKAKENAKRQGNLLSFGGHESAKSLVSCLQCIT